jgi:hypothetical protein
MTTWQPRLRVKHSITSLFFRGSTGLQPSAVQSLSWRRTATWTEPQGLKRPVLVVTHGFVKFWLYIGNVQLEPLCFRVFWNVNLNINMFCLYHRQFILFWFTSKKNVESTTASKLEYPKITTSCLTRWATSYIRIKSVNHSTSNRILLSDKS